MKVRVGPALGALEPGRGGSRAPGLRGSGAPEPRAEAGSPAAVSLLPAGLLSPLAPLTPPAAGWRRKDVSAEGLSLVACDCAALFGVAHVFFQPLNPPALIRVRGTTARR